jgi:hypothetical protein
MAGWRSRSASRKTRRETSEELALVKSADGTGINIRFYDKQRVNIHVTVKHHGKAVAKADAKACQVKRVGDSFVFNILDQISIGPVEPQRNASPLAGDG